MVLQVFFEDDTYSIFGIEKQYEIVRMEAVEVIKKHTAYDAAKWVRDYQKFPTTRDFIISDFIIPLDKEGLGLSKPVKKYLVLHNGKVVMERIPKNDFEDDAERLAFWKAIIGLLI
jgi:hypothetical protein